MTQVADIFSNRYAIQRGIARGGMAQVYLAHDQLLDRPVAVKVLFPEFARDPSFVERFRREAQAAANLNHPNIVGIYDWGREQGTYFIVMEYVEGQALRDVIRSRGRLEPGDAAAIAAEIAGAVAFAHRNGVVHRDIKPGNVLLAPGGRVKVTDFGIARATQGDVGEALTQTGAVMGTATYFSPEQAQGLPVDGRSDVYSLGVLLYEMVTGAPPFTGDSPVAVAYKHVREEVVRPSERNGDIPADLERIVLTALAKDVDARYQSADDLRDDLARFQRGQPLAAAPLTAVVADLTGAATAAAAETRAMSSTGATRAGREYREPERRSHTGTIVGAGLAIALLVGLIVLLLLIGDDRGGGGGATVAVPDVVGTQFDDARALLEQRGFEVRRIDQDSSEPADKVLRQDPGEGQKLEKSGTVRLFVSAATAEMPNVVGQEEQQARGALQRAGLTNIQALPEESDTVAPGMVIRTVPPAGAEVDKAGQVTLVVATEAPVTIPAVANFPQAQAEQALRDAGFQVTLAQEASDTIPAGRATRTDPAEGTRAARNANVTLFVSTGPEQVEVPDTEGMTQSEAADTLVFAGFDVTVMFVPAPPGQNGRVINQSPEGGQTATRGSNVTIFVGQSP